MVLKILCVLWQSVDINFLFLQSSVGAIYDWRPLGRHNLCLFPLHRPIHQRISPIYLLFGYTKILRFSLFSRPRLRWAYCAVLSSVGKFPSGASILWLRMELRLCSPLSGHNTLRHTGRARDRWSVRRLCPATSV